MYFDSSNPPLKEVVRQGCGQEWMGGQACWSMWPTSALYMQHAPPAADRGLRLLKPRLQGPDRGEESSPFFFVVLWRHSMYLALKVLHRHHRQNR